MTTMDLWYDLAMQERPDLDASVIDPGEAKDADVGIAGGVGKGALFRKGKVVGVFAEDKLLDALLAEVDKILIENGEAPYSDIAPPAPAIEMLTPGRSVPARERV